jgi:hypothetical protein
MNTLERPVSAELMPTNVSAVEAAPARVAPQPATLPAAESPPDLPTAVEAAPVLLTAAHRDPAKLPTQRGPKGLRFDFNDGCRVVMPKSEHPWRVRLSDLDTGNVLHETEVEAGQVNSAKRYFVRFRLEVWQQAKSLLVHEYSAAGQEVLIRAGPNARRHYRLVSLRREIPAAPSMPAYLCDEQEAHPALSRRTTDSMKLAVMEPGTRLWIPRLCLMKRGDSAWQDGAKRSNWR